MCRFVEHRRLRYVDRLIIKIVKFIHMRSNNIFFGVDANLILQKASNIRKSTNFHKRYFAIRFQLFIFDYRADFQTQRFFRFTFIKNIFAHFR